MRIKFTPTLMAAGLVLGSSAFSTQLQAQSATASAGSGQPVSTVQPSLAVNFIVATEGVFPSNGDRLASYGGSLLGEIRMFAGDFVPAGFASADGSLLQISSNAALFSLLGIKYGGNGFNTFALPDLRGRTILGIGTGPGLSTYTAGEQVGSSSVTLTEGNMAAHQHGLVSVSTGSRGGGQAFENRQPSLAFDVQVATEGNPDYVGEIRTFGYSNFLNTSGVPLDISDFYTLYQKIGTTYGGDENEFFGPDFRGRVLLGAGQGPGLTNRDNASKEGSETSVMGSANLPPHTHAYTAGTTASAGGGEPVNNMQPYVAIRYYVCVSGVYPDQGPGGGAPYEYPYVGEIRAFAHSEEAPPNSSHWVLADGSLLPINTNQALFSLLGTTYGGDGRTTFALPDLRGRVPVGASASLPLGTVTGTENLVLGVNNLPAHTHTFPEATVSSPTSENVATTTAVLGGHVTGDGGAAISERGIVFASTSVNANPKLGGTGVTKLTSAGTTGVFTVNASSLTPQTGYSYTAFVTNGAGTFYSASSTFATLSEIEAWRKTWFGSTDNSGNGADNADPYGTGVKNLLVFGLIGPSQNPATARASQLPQWVRQGESYICTFSTPAGVGPISYSAEYSYTLQPGSWNSLSNVGSGGTNIFSVPAGNGDKVFLRIIVNR